MSTTLPLFWHLSSASQKDRIDASADLVSALEQFQTQFIPKDSPGTSDEEAARPKSDGLDALNAQDVSYSIRRLIRGLASPRESSRLGFAVALTELLSRIDTVTCSQIVSIIIHSSKTQGSMTGQEERDAFFARLFGLTSVIQSGLLVRQTPLPTFASTSIPASNLEGYKETLSQLLLLGEKKSWLRESAWWTMSLALDALNTSDVPWKEEAVDATAEKIFFDNELWTPEKVALALKLQTWYPEYDWRNRLSPTFKNPEMLSTGNLTTLARILKESSPDEDDGSNGSKPALGNWKPQVHFVWDVILDQLLSTTKTPKSSKASFQEFFRLVVDESLFSSASSPERKYWGFQIFQKALPRVAASDMPILFTKNFMRSWINHLSNHDRYLHKAAKQVATNIQSFIQQNPTLGFTLILQLTGTNGNRQFDKLTKTKTVESILASMDVEGIETYIDYLLKQANETSGQKDDIHGINARRAWIIDQLGYLIRNGSIPKKDSWIQSILDWFIVNGLFIIKKKSEKSPYRALHAVPIPAFSDDLRQCCRARLLGCLGDLTGQVTLIKLEDDKTLKVSGVASDGQLWVSRALATIEALKEDTRHATLLERVDEDVQNVRTKARQVADTLRQRSHGRQETAQGAELLLLATVLQQYSADVEETDMEVLEACIGATTRMFAPDSKNSHHARKSSRDADVVESVSEPIDVLVDSIIGFLDQSTAYLRSVANQAFSLLSSAVQKTTIELILTQLERRNPAELPADDKNIDYSEEEEESVDDDQTPSDDENDNEYDASDDALELRQKIEETLRVNGVETAKDDSDEEANKHLMDDDQMIAIDEQIAQVFRLRINEKKSSKDVDAQREATHFKNRVLDLVDVFVKKQPTSHLVIPLMISLVDLITSTSRDERQLSDKATGILRNRIGKSKDLPVGIDTEEVTAILDELHGRARKARSPEVLVTLSQCSLYLSKVLLHSEAGPSVLRVYRSSLVDFVTRKASTLNATFIQDFIRHYPGSGWSLRNDMIDVSKNAVNVYRRCQAFQLLNVVINQMPALGNRQHEILTFMSTCYAALMDFMTKACDGEFIVTAPQMKDLFKLGLAAVRQTQLVTPSQDTLQIIWRPSSWDALHKKLTTSERFKASMALQTMCLQMTKSSKGTNPSKKPKIINEENHLEAVAAVKRKADAGGNDEDTAATRKAKRKKVKKAEV